MVRRLVCNLVAMLLLITTASAALAQGGGSLAGKVTDGDKGTAVAGANVQVLSGLSTMGRAVTGNDGSYRVAGLSDGTYAVVLTRIGFSARRIEGVSVSGAATMDFTMVEFASRLNAVVTTANRGAAPQKELDIPASLSVVSSETFESKPAPTLASYLKGVPGISISTGGIVQSNIVSRGFNNAFSGAMLNLQDYRFAGVPSLRVNIPSLYIGTKEDIARVEVLNGPASSLYGPNSANGVVHIITKSPFESQGTSIAMEGGTQDLMRVSGRHAGVVGSSKSIGYKLSGEYFSAMDFEYFDPNEPTTYPSIAPPGRANTPLVRDFSVKRSSAEARLDYRPNDHLENILTGGFSRLGNGIELTTVFGAAQAKNWTSTSIQDRFKYKNFFAQVFWTGNNSGNDSPTDLDGSYYLRTGIPVVDKSNVLVGQVQQTFDVANWNLITGVDYISTKPRSDGTIFGRNEGATDIIETGAYVQGAYPLGSTVDLTVALRGDQNDRMEGTQFSPRLALTWKQTETSNWRATFSRAFNSPASFNFFLDQISNPTVAPGFALRGIGSPPKSGWQFNRSCDASVNSGLCMRSPWAGGGTTALSSTATAAYPGFISQLATVAAGLPNSTFGGAAGKAGFIGLFNAVIKPTLSAGAAPTAAQVKTVLRVGSSPVSVASIKDLGPLAPSFDNTWEVGYKAILNDRIRLAVDAWYQVKGAGPPIGQLNPTVHYDGATLGAFLGGKLGAPLTQFFASPQGGGLSGAALAATVSGTISQFTTLMATLPQGSIALDNPLLASDQSIIATWQTGVGTVDVHGFDVALDFQINDRWLAAFSYSNQDRVVFNEFGTINPLMSNSPKNRGTLNITHTNDAKGLTIEAGARYSDAYPVNSGIFNSLGSPPNPAGIALYKDVPTQTLFDVSASWRLPVQANVTWSVNVQNAANTPVPTFVGVPNITRLMITRLQWNF
ncbi:MAG: TonB-dependent receptor [Gemmatimonadetes bacterium]|nr:TonB-dependent receptor [Gemmatimonadota bacterium]